MRVLFWRGVRMGHDWLFDVLADMRAYAERHGMGALAAKIDETVEVARQEVTAAEQGGDGGLSNTPARRR